MQLELPFLLSPRVSLIVNMGNSNFIIFEKVALIKTDYEERSLQPTPAGLPKVLSTGYLNIFHVFHFRAWAYGKG